LARKSLRWLVFGAFVVAVIAMAIFNTISNRTLVSGLRSGSVGAFRELSTRPDASAVFAALQEHERIAIAEKLAQWHSPTAVELILILLKEPTASVRNALTSSLSAHVARDSDSVSMWFDAAEPERRSAIIAACQEANAQGLAAAVAAFPEPAKRPTASIVILRAGVGALTSLEPLLESEDQTVILDVADLHSALGAKSTPELERRLRPLALEGADPIAKDRAMLLCARLDVPGLWDEYREIALDIAAPVDLRAECIRALVRAGLADRVAHLAASPERRIREAMAPVGADSDKTI
jgi:hypothetical protein